MKNLRFTRGHRQTPRRVSKATMFVVIVLSTVILALSVASAATTFSDVRKQDWFHNDVTVLSGKQILSGYPDGTFKPGNSVTLGQFLAIATRLVAPQQIDEGNPGEYWAVRNHRAAVAAGLIKSSEFPATLAALEGAVTREDMAYILVNIAAANGETLKALDGIESAILDYSAIAGSRKNAVKLAYSNGLLTGGTDKKFNPKNYLSRAEVAAVFCRVMNYTPRPGVVPGSEEPPRHGASADAMRVLELANEARQKNGLKPLVMDKALVEAATEKAKEMAASGSFSHNSACYGSVGNMLCTFGVDWMYCGENLAVGQSTPVKVFNDWMGSECHRDQILSPSFAKTGIAAARDSKGKIYWVQLFAG